MIIQREHESSVVNTEQAKYLIKQVLSLARQKGLMSKECTRGSSLSNKSMKLWNFLAEKEEFFPHLSHVLTLVSYTEALLLMEAAIRG